MSLLPQRKKSAEEIAKLRETLGIPGQAPVADETPVAEPASAIKTPLLAVEASVLKAPVPLPKPAPPAPETPEPEPVEDVVEPPPTHLDPPPTFHSHREVRSLKRSERGPVLAPEKPIQLEKPDAPVHISPPPGPAPRSARSLRKAERVPVTPTDIHTPPADSKLPVHRHSDQELNDLRRKAAIAQQGAVVPFAGMTAHRALLIPGYLAVIAAAGCFYYHEMSIGVTSGCVAAALLIAVFIFVRKPLSRHHAAFIAVMSMFVIVFGALRYFPQLSYGTFPLPAEDESAIHKDL